MRWEGLSGGLWTEWRLGGKNETNGRGRGEEVGVRASGPNRLVR